MEGTMYKPKTGITV